MLYLSSNHKTKPGKPVAQLSLLVLLKQQCEKGYKGGSGNIFCVWKTASKLGKIKKGTFNNSTESASLLLNLV